MLDYATIAKLVPLIPMFNKKPTELTRDDVSLIGDLVGVQITDDLFEIIQTFLTSFGDQSLNQILSGMTLDKLRAHAGAFLQGAPPQLDVMAQCPTCRSVFEHSVSLTN